MNKKANANYLCKASTVRKKPMVTCIKLITTDFLIHYSNFKFLVASSRHAYASKYSIFCQMSKYFPLLTKKRFHCLAEFFRQLSLRRMAATLDQLQFFLRSRYHVNIVLDKSYRTDPVA